MFRSRLHPTPSALAFGLVVIALWALIWLWFLLQLSGPTLEAQARRPAPMAWNTARGVRGLV